MDNLNSTPGRRETLDRARAGWTIQDITADDSAVPFIGPATRHSPYRAASTIVTQFQRGHGWSASGTGLGSANLNDAGDFVRGTQAARFTTAGNGSPANLERLALGTLDLTRKMIRLTLKIDDITHASFLNFFVGTNGLVNNFKWIIQRTTSTISQNWISSGEWVVVTLQWADVNSAAGSYRLSALGVPSTTSGFTDMRVQVIDDAGGRVTAHAQAVEVVNNTAVNFPNGVVSVVFDDSSASMYDIARPIMDKAGFRGTLYTIADAIDTPWFQTMAQLRSMQDLNGWEVAGHAYARANHDAGFNKLTSDVVVEDLRNLRAWMTSNGFHSDHFAYPRGFFGATIDGVQIESLVRRHFATGRSINYDSLIESSPEAMPHRLRAVSSISSRIGPTSRPYPGKLVGSGGLLDRCRRETSWLILTFHKLVTGSATLTTECSQADFQSIMNGIASRGIPVLPVGDVMHKATS